MNDNRMAVCDSVCEFFLIKEGCGVKSYPLDIIILAEEQEEGSGVQRAKKGEVEGFTHRV